MLGRTMAKACRCIFSGVLQPEGKQEGKEANHYLELLINTTNEKWQDKDLKLQLITQTVPGDHDRLGILQKGMFAIQSRTQCYSTRFYN